MALGGHLMVTQGAVDKLKHENEIAFVICHELGHFYGRHVVKAMGRGISLAVLSALVGVQETGASFVNQASEFGGLSFSRKQETEADHFAMDCLNQHYGHVAGFDRFFKEVRKEEGVISGSKLMSYSSSHPATKDRIDRLNAYIKKQGYKTEGSLIKHEIKTN